MNEESRERALFETSSIPRAIGRLALPTVIGQAILVIYNMADTFFIGLTGSDAMVTAVTVCTPAFMFLSAISNLFGVGGSSVISRSLGARQANRARKTAAFSFWGCLFTTLLYALGAYLLLDPFIDALGGSDAVVHAQARGYLIITVVAGGVFTSIGALLGHLVRSEGRSMQASVGIVLGGLLNIALDPLFMFVLLPRGQEILGAALATALSNLISALYFAALLVRHSRGSVISVRPCRAMFTGGVPAAVLSCGLPACIMTLFENVSYAVLDHLMALNGVALQAGIGVAKKVNMLAHSIVRGMAQGVLPLISYNYASGNHKRMRHAALLSMGISVTLATMCMTASLAFSEPLIELFIPHGTASVQCGARFLCILCIGGPFSACAYAIISFFQAVGCGMRSFVLAILRKGLLDIPLMLLLRGVSPVYGIVWATPIADIVCCAASAVLFTAFLHGRRCAHSKPAPALD